MADMRIGTPVSLGQASAELATERLDARDRRHLERFLDLPSLRQNLAPKDLAQPGLNALSADYAEPELDNPQILRLQNFTRLLDSIDKTLAEDNSGDPVVKLTRLVLQQELSKHDMLRNQLGALVER